MMQQSTTTELVKATLIRRNRREKRFRLYGLCSLLLSISFLVVLLFYIFSNGLPAFKQTYVKLDIVLDAKLLGVTAQSSEEELRSASYQVLVNKSLYKAFPDVKKRKQKKALKSLVSNNAQYTLLNAVIENPAILGTTKSFWFLADDDIDQFVKGNIPRELEAHKRRVKDFQIAWVDELLAKKRIETRFAINFFTSADSREPEQAGILGALIGSMYTMLITLLFSFPVAVAAAIYLEEFAPKNNRWIDIVEININNLAAVPSIIFGLLGMVIIIPFLSQFFDGPRSTPFAGGLVLTLMTLPTIIIASRAAIKAVPPSIRSAALGLGASDIQTVYHHVLPLAMPGILTGSIIGMAQALGETAPLLMIGMVAFILDVPSGVTSPATVLPVQIFLWSDSPERAFTEKTSAAIIVLLFFLIMMNLIAVILRKRFERRW